MMKMKREGRSNNAIVPGRQGNAQLSSLDLAVQRAAKSFRVTERAKADIVQNQLVQFSEILKIKLRNRLLQSKFKARRLWETITENGGSFFVPQAITGVRWDTDSVHMGGSTGAGPNSSGTNIAPSSGLGMEGIRHFGSAISLFVPQGAFGKLGFGLLSVMTVGAMYKKLVHDIRTIAILVVSGKAAQMAFVKIQAMELNQLLNFILAFEETGEDELESERIVRDISEQIAVRHINHISKLSKNGHRTLASVIVNRLFRHISKHRYGFHGESLIWYKSELQQKVWALESLWKRLTLPADRVSTRPHLNLIERCLRALTAESTESDDLPLEIEPLHEEGSSRQSIWSASGVLSRSAVMVHDEGQLYVHSLTDVSLYGYVYGTANEVRWRRLRKYTVPNTPEEEQEEDLPQEGPNFKLPRSNL